MPGMLPSNDLILKRFRATLAELYGDRLERVVLFGSRARGDAHAESDYDEMNRLADLSTKLIEEGGPFVHAMPYRAGSYNERTPLMLAIRTDGLDL